MQRSPITFNFTLTLTVNYQYVLSKPAVICCHLRLLLGRSTLPAKHHHRPTGFLWGWSVGVELIAGLHLRDPAVGRDTFRQHLKTFMFASF